MKVFFATMAWVLFTCAPSGQAAGSEQAKPAHDETRSPHLAMPPYPYQARQKGLTGSGMCRVTFDASGHATKATMTKSTGWKMLDENTTSFAQKNWTGKPGTSVNVPVSYTLLKSTSPSTRKVVAGGVCRVTFDATGRVSEAVMVKSLGSPVLDNNTVNFARRNWTGPPNATRDVPITYQR